MSSENPKEKDFFMPDNEEPFDFSILTTPTITASEDGFNIVVAFPRPSGEVAPLTPATFATNPFGVSFDNLPVPIIRARRDKINFITACDIATINNITLSGNSQTIDGQAATDNKRVLVKNQNNAALNGIYIVSSGNWARAADFNQSNEIIGAFTYVLTGTANINKAFATTNIGTVNLGTTEIIFQEISNLTGFSYILELAEPIKHDMDVRLSMTFTNENERIDYGVSNSVIPDFSNQIVNVNNVKFPIQFFDPLDWVLRGYSGTLPSGNILERRFGFPHQTIGYDKGAPVGEVYLDQSRETSNAGMRVIHFGCYSNDDVNNTYEDFLTGLYYIQDILENPIKETSSLNAGSSSTYVSLGQNFNAILVHYLNNQSVKSIEFGILATTPKNYVIEALPSPNGAWTPLIYMYASSITQEFFRYVFSTNQNLFAVRIRYRGDYFYQDNNGLVSLGAKDSFSGVEAIRLAHFTNFSDSRDFALKLVNNDQNNPNLLNDTGKTTKNEGWLAFIEGSAVYNWDMVNNSLLWNNFATITNTAESWRMVTFNDKLIVVTYLTENSIQRSKIYIVNSDGTLANTNPASIPRVTAILSANNKIYLATFDNSQARVWDAFAGNSIILQTPIWSRNFIEVKSLAYYKNLLWIGTGYDQNLIAQTPSIVRSFLYTLAGNTESLKTYFDNKEILSMSFVNTASGKLYIGLGGSSNTSGQIYYTDGDSISFWLDTNSKSVDQIEYYSEQSKLWIGCSDGKLLTATLNPDGTANAVETSKELGINVKFLGFDASPGLFWVVSSIENEAVLVYNRQYNIFYDVFQPSNTIFVDIAYYTSNGVVNVFGLTKDNRILKINVEIFNSEERNVYLQVRDLAQNVSTITYTDSIIFGVPENETSPGQQEQLVNGAIYQIRIPKIYYYIPAVLIANTNGTQYQIARKWTSEDEAVVYEKAVGGINYVITSLSLYPHTLNNTTGIITFTQSQTARNVEFFVTIKAPKQQNLRQIGNAFRPLGLGASYYAPEKALRKSGIYISEILNIPSITAWNKIEMRMEIPATPAVDPTTGFESGVQVDVYVRTADTRDDLNKKDWGLPFTYSTINTTSPTGTVTLSSANNNQYNLSSFTGAFFQFKIVLTTATLNISPTVDYIKIFYFTAKESKFFSKMFDTQSSLKKIRRGLLTYNGTPNGGKIQFKYLANETETNRFILSSYEDITPNTVFTLEEEAKTIRFAILLTSVGEVNNINSKASVDEFAVQLDTGKDDLYWMR